MHQVDISWNDDEATNLFTAAATADVRAADIVLEEFTVRGSWQKNGNTKRVVEESLRHPGGLAGFPIVMRQVDGLTVRRVASLWSRIMGIRADSCSAVTIEACDVECCGRDGINVSASSGVSIRNNSIRHVDDDGIAAHSTNEDAAGVRAGLSIIGNRLFDCQGISVIAGRTASIAGNILDFCKGYGISITTLPSGASEGQAAAQSVVVSANVITNLVSRARIDGRTSGCPGILVSGTSARDGAGPAIPGEAITAGPDAGHLLDPYPAFENNAAANAPVAMTRGILLSGNIIARQVPPADGTVAGFTRVSDWRSLPRGLFLCTGWFDGALSIEDLTDYGVRLEGTLADILVSGNQISGMSGGLAIGNAKRIDNISFRGNQVSDFRLAGVELRSFGFSRIAVEDNLFDGDPFYQAPLRGSEGSWRSSADPGPVGVRAQKTGRGIFLRRNLFKNLFRIAEVDSSVPDPGFEFIDNIAEAWPCATGYDPRNRGIGVIDPEGGVRYAIVAAAPRDGNFGAVIQPIALAAAFQPESGIWVQGRFLRNARPSLQDGRVVTGWLRLTTGGGNVRNVDWIELETQTRD